MMVRNVHTLKSSALNWSTKFNYLALILTILSALFSYFSYSSMQALQKAAESRYDSYLLTENLRLSSDQLTLMVRTYAVTGDNKYLGFFKDILAIRNGIKPQPLNYHRIYWDMLMPENGKAPFPDGQQRSLKYAMVQAGFTEQELEQLQKSQQASDRLTELEGVAVNHIEEALLYQDGFANSPMRETALSILFSEDYLISKSIIMSFINEFSRLQEERTKQSVEQAAETHHIMTILSLVSVITLLVVLFLNFRLKHKINQQFISMLIKDVSVQTEKIQEQNSMLVESMDMMEAAKKELVESEKMASLGSLVAGVAHEVNTPVGIGITAITNLQTEIKGLNKAIINNELSKRSLNNYLDIFAQSANLVLTNLTRVASLVKSFKNVAVDQSYDEIRNIDLKENIQDIVNSLMPKYKCYGIKVNVNIDDGIRCDIYPGALAQIISNLVINAFIHAFDEDKNGCINISASQGDTFLELTVNDNGYGMDELQKIKVFEPFFTTKRNKGGTGLGLHIVYNLVTQKLLGQISCTSVQGEGSEFKVLFPKKIVAQSN
jgi:signal transduction histidine kinase